MLTSVCMFHLLNIVVEPAMTDTSSTLTERQCIEVFINSFCNESADSFLAQLQYTEGMCGNNTAPFISTENYTLNEKYRQCVPINVTGTVCYKARVFQNSMVVDATKAQQLQLLPCFTNSFIFLQDNGVLISNVYSGQEEVPHNTVVKYWCDRNGFLSELSQTRCINGTFEPLVTIHITCSGGK